MLQLIQGLYRPTEGRILIDGVPLAQLDETASQTAVSSHTGAEAVSHDGA